MVKSAGRDLEEEAQGMEVEALQEKYYFHDEEGVEGVMQIA